jgi:hypothetical protein
VDEVRHGLDHAKLDVVVDAAHQPKVQDAQPAVRRADEVARVRVRLQRVAAQPRHLIQRDSKTQRLLEILQLLLSKQGAVCFYRLPLYAAAYLNRSISGSILPR